MRKWTHTQPHTSKSQHNHKGVVVGRRLLGGAGGGLGLCSLRGALLPASVIPLVAGSLGGAIGVGVAYPFDTLKTKAQIYEGTVTLDRGGGEGRRQSLGMLAIARNVIGSEGLGGFYGNLLLYTPKYTTVYVPPRYCMPTDTLRGAGGVCGAHGLL
jgi:hypothetical protein